MFDFCVLLWVANDLRTVCFYFWLVFLLIWLFGDLTWFVFLVMLLCLRWIWGLVWVVFDDLLTWF